MQQSSDFATRVLLVEDNPIDIRLMRFALDKDCDWRTVMTVAEDGEKAIQLLNQSLQADEGPDFVILDLNLPKRDGTEVLQWIRTTAALKDLPVAILSSSPVDVIRDRVQGAHVEADGYFVKPIEVDAFFALTKDLRSCYQNAASSS